MRSPLFPAIALLVASLSMAHGAQSPESEPEKGFWSVFSRAWTATADAAGAATRVTGNAIKATGQAVQSTTGSVMGIFGRSERGKDKVAAKLPVQVEVECSPSPIFLKETPKVQVTVKALNVGKRAQLLEFSSARRAEAVLRDAAGQIVSRGSYDIAVRAEPGMVTTLNPGERLEYVLSLSTSGLQVGKAYTLEAALVGQVGLTARIPVTVR